MLSSVPHFNGCQLFDSKTCILHKLGVSLQLPPNPRIVTLSLLKESFALKKEISFWTTLLERVLIWDFFLCLFTPPVPPSGLWQVGRYVVVHWNLCMPDNFCPGSANTDTNHLPDEPVSRATVPLSRWAFDAFSFGCWIFPCSCNRISARPLPHPGPARWAVFYRGSVSHRCDWTGRGLTLISTEGGQECEVQSEWAAVKQHIEKKKGWDDRENLWKPGMFCFEWIPWLWNRGAF